MRQYKAILRTNRLAPMTVALLILLTALYAVVSPVHAAQNTAVKLSVQAGYDSYFRGSEWIPLQIQVSNDGPEIAGTLEVTYLNTPGLGASAYKTSIDLPTKSSKQVFMYVVLESYVSQLQVDLVNADGVVVASDNRSMKLARPFDQIYAVITESPRGAVDLKSVRTGAGESYQINWGIANIPPNAAGLRGMDALVLTDVDTGNLTNDQRQAIRDWVLTGGHLVVSGGPSWQKTQAGLADLLPFQPSGTTTLTALPSLATFAGTPADKLAAPDGTTIIVAQGKVLPDTQVMIQESGTPMLVRKTLGEGLVDYLTTDPGLEPYLSWGGRGTFWFTVFSTSGQQRPSWSHGIIDVNQATYAANSIKGARLPDVFQLCGFLAVYIILIGPLNYLILRRIGRRELAWFTIPIVILLCSVTAYATGFSLRGTAATVNRLALVQVWPGSDRAEVDGVLGVLAPRRAFYDVVVKNGLSLDFMTNSTYGNTPSGTRVAIRQDANNEAQNVPVDAGLTAAFAVNGYVPAPKLDGAATIVLTKASGTVIKVNFKNTTGMVLNDAILVAMGVSRELGTLAPDQEVTIDVPMTGTISPQLMLGSIGNLSGSTNYNYNFNYGYGYNYNGGTVKDLMGTNFQNNYYGYGSYGYNSEQEEMRRRQTFLQAMVADIDITGGRGTSVYVAGWTNTSPIDVDLTGASFNTEDTTLYIYSLPVSAKADVKSPDDSIELPNSFLTWTLGKDSPKRDFTPYSINLSLSDQVVFRYSTLPVVRLSDVTGMTVTIKNNNNSPTVGQGIVSMWDWANGKWVDLQVSGYLTRVSNPTRFVGPENTIDVLIEVAPNQQQVNYGSFDITLYGKLGTQSATQ